jgi:FkbM family methyltransferase
LPGATARSGLDLPGRRQTTFDMGLGIKTRLIRWTLLVFRYRLPALRWKLYGDTSQHGEFLVLRRLTVGDFPKFVVEVGANDGMRHSNSYPFLARGWSGILIEPNPRVYADLEARYRGTPGITTLNYACGPKPGRLPLFLGLDGEIGEFATLRTDDTEYYRQTRTNQSVEVNVETLTTLLARARCPAHFGILSVDTEGFDFEVLSSLDFAQFHPRIILTEDENETDDPKFQLLRNQGYRFFRRFHRNSIWLSRRAPCAPAIG